MGAMDKKFESIIKTGLEEIPGSSVDRLKDPQGGFAGVANICDFMMYIKPYLFYFELKVRAGNLLNFKADITENQWEGMLAKSKIRGVGAGIILWYYEHEITVFVSIQELQRLRLAGNKSLNIKHIENKEVDFIELTGECKRKYYKYDFVSFIRQLAERLKEAK